MKYEEASIEVIYFENTNVVTVSVNDLGQGDGETFDNKVKGW